MERAWLPAVPSSARAVRTARCGAFDDDLEVARGWTVNPDGTDTAPAAAGSSAATRHRRRVRARSSSGRPRPAADGVRDRAGRRRDARPRTTSTAGRRSGRPRSTLPAGAGQRLTFRYVFAHDVALDLGRHAAGDRRADRRHPGRRLHEVAGLGRRRRRRVADGLDLDGRLRRADGPPPVRGRRRRAGQPARGRARRHPGDPAELTVIDSSSSVVYSSGMRFFTSKPDTIPSPAEALPGRSDADHDARASTGSSARRSPARGPRAPRPRSSASAASGATRRTSGSSPAS